jgi:hypothetical protein
VADRAADQGFVRRLRSWLVSLLACALVITLGTGGGVAQAAFTRSVTAGSASYATAHIFTGTRSASARGIEDAAGGSPTDTKTQCHYFEVYNGATLLGTYGSSGTPYECSSDGVNWTQDSITLAEVDTVTKANNLVIKIYGKNSGSKPAQFDLLQVAVNWKLV